MKGLSPKQSVCEWRPGRWVVWAGLSLVGVCTVGAQQPGQVPRALPVEDAPPRMEVPRAVPVSPDTRTPPRAAVVEENRPKGPDEDLFSYGTLLYERGEFALAAKTYSDYLSSYPGRRHTATALFRIGECLIKQGQEAQAVRYYEEVVSNHPRSEGAPSAAYRLGALRFNARDFEGSARYFTFCEKATQVPQVRLAAAYNLSRAYQMMGQTGKQFETLRRVTAVREDNPYWEAASMTLAKGLLAGNSLEQALALFEDLAANAKDSAVLAEAKVNAGVLLGEMKRTGDAERLFGEALRMRETTPENRGIALVGVVQSLYDKGSYDAVIDQYQRNSTVLPPGPARGKMLLLVANAYRMKKTYSRAVELYLMVEQDYPTEDVAFEAGYWKVYCFYLLEDKDLAEFAAGYIKRWATDKAGHEMLAKASLIRADHFFNAGKYDEAAEAFAEVPMEALSAELRASALFNMGYAQVESKRFQDAVATLTRFLTEAPQHELRANALAQRGLAHREAKDLAKAKADFNEVTRDFPKGAPAELAWYQLGLIASEERNPDDKVRAFESLVKLFPQSQAVPQAWFGIGAAAFEKQDWAKAQEALRRAIRLDPKAYVNSANQMLVMSYYSQEDVEGLASAIDDFVAQLPSAAVPPNVLGWLGLSLFAKDEFKRAVRYLALATTPDEPQNTMPTIWNYLGMAQVETGAFKPAIEALNHFLDVTPQPGKERGQALLYRSRAFLGLDMHTEALASADEALGFIKTGRLHADLLLVEGDVLFDRAGILEKEGRINPAIEEYRAAAAKFIVPSQFFVDPVVTPKAIWRTIRALEKAGDVDRARTLRTELSAKYPKFSPADGE